MAFKKKRSNWRDLIGLVVMVCPTITTNDGSGKTGTVFSVTEQTGKAIIKLSDGTHSEYPINDLVTLAPKAIILQRLMGHWDISPKDFKMALKVCRLITDKRIAEAFEIAVENKTLQSSCTVSCSEWLETTSRKIKRKGIGK